MEDPNEMYQWLGSIGAFLVLAPLLALTVIYGGTKLMTYFEKREAERESRQNKHSEEQ